jgi:hypothetical protein
MGSRGEAGKAGGNTKPPRRGVDKEQGLALAVLRKEESMPFSPNPDGTWQEIRETAQPGGSARQSIPDREVPESEKKAAKEKAKAALAASGREDRLVRWWNSAMERLGRPDEKI